MTTELIQYLRRDGHPFGCMVAQKIDCDDGAVVQIGWSLCNKKDLFRKAQARRIARGRAIGREQATKVPQEVIRSLREEMAFFSLRALKFFEAVVVKIPGSIISD